MGLKEGWAGGEKVGRERDWAEREGEGFGFLFFFKPISFKTLFKIKLFSNFKHFKLFSKFSNHFKNF
jgi:hypothetical protein